MRVIRWLLGNDQGCGCEEPTRGPKNKSPLENKAAKDAREEYYEPTREDNIWGRNETRLALWEERLKDPIVALDKALKCEWKMCIRGLGPSAWRKECVAMAGVGFFQSLWEKPIWEGVWPYLDPMENVCLRTASKDWNVPGKYEPHGELFFFLIQKEPATEPFGETFSPFFNADIRTPPSSLLMSSRIVRSSPCA